MTVSPQLGPAANRTEQPAPAGPLGHLFIGGAHRGDAMIPWKLWTSLPSVELWQAVALLLDIDPDSLAHHPSAWMAGPGRGPVLESRSFPSAAKREAFDNALSFAKRAATYGGPIALPRGYAPSDAGNAGVSLREVAAFFLGCDWPDIPAPLLALLSVEDSHRTGPTTETKAAPGTGAAARADEPAGIVSGGTLSVKVAKFCK